MTDERLARMQDVKDAIESALAERKAALLTVARELARALCLGQRGFGSQGDRLPDVDAARKHCAKLLELLGGPGPYHYDQRDVVPALVLAFRTELEILRRGEGGFVLGGRWFTEQQVREALAWMEEKTK